MVKRPCHSPAGLGLKSQRSEKFKDHNSQRSPKITTRFQAADEIAFAESNDRYFVRPDPPAVD